MRSYITAIRFMLIRARKMRLPFFGLAAAGLILGAIASTIFLSLSLVVFFNFARNKIPPKEQYIGHIQPEATPDYIQLIKLHKVISLDSRGGNAETAFNIAKQIYKNKNVIDIRGDCLSACAEFFIPAASGVITSEQSLIGYHISDFILDELPLKGYDKSKDCDVKRLAWLKNIYMVKGYKIKLHAEVFSRLSFSNSYKTYYNKENKCTGFTIGDPKISMWFPTSYQLEKFAGYKFNSKICSDNMSCWKARIESMADIGEKFMVGDRVLVFTGETLRDVTVN